MRIAEKQIGPLYISNNPGYTDYYCYDTSDGYLTTTMILYRSLSLSEKCRKSAVKGYYNRLVAKYYTPREKS